MNRFIRNLRTLQSIAAFGLTAFHIGILVTIFGLFMKRGYTFPEMTTCIAIILPMLGVYVTAGIKHIIKMASVPDDGKLVNLAYALFVLLLPAVYSACLFLLVLSWALYRQFDDFDQFKIALCALETIFGLYTGLLISSLFGGLERWEGTKTPKTPTEVSST